MKRMLKRSESQEIISTNKPYRSNSFRVSKDGIKIPMTPLDRNSVNNTPFGNINDRQDELKSGSIFTRIFSIFCSQIP